VALLTQQYSPATRLILLLESPAGEQLAPQFPASLPELLALPLHGCCLKSEINEALVYHLRGVAAGGTWFSQGVLKSYCAGQAQGSNNLCFSELTTPLTAGEQRVFALVVRGLDNLAIMAELGLAEQTVRNYVKTIYYKLGTHNRAELVARFHGVVAPKAQS
jgi:DNA-binding NarL/FixJ family response regulator